MILLNLNHFDSIPQYTTFLIIFMASRNYNFSWIFHNFCDLWLCRCHKMRIIFCFRLHSSPILKQHFENIRFWQKLSILEKNHDVKFWFVSLSNLMCPFENHRNFRVRYFPQWQSQNSRYGSPKFVSHIECDPYKSPTEKIFFILMEHDAWDRKRHFNASTTLSSKLDFKSRSVGDQEFWNKECI